MLCTVMLASEAQAVEIGLPSGLTAAPNLGGTELYFGNDGGDPIEWHVVAKDSASATLWTTTDLVNRTYDTTHGAGGAHQNWSGSDICAWLNGPFLLDTFGETERTAIEAYSNQLESGLSGGAFEPSQQIVLPSVAEIGAGDGVGTWEIPYTNSATDGKRGFGDLWWLRTPGSTLEFAAYVDPNGFVDDGGDYVYFALAVRPAFRLKLSSVLFTSAASGANGKNSAAVGDGLVAATATTGPVKLTVIDNTNLSLTCTDTAGRNVEAGDTVSIAYSGAQAAPDKYVSCLIENGSGAVLFYGKLSDTASGAADFTVPAALPNGNYAVKLFNEECNGDDRTDFASSPISIALTVGDNTVCATPTPSPAAGTYSAAQSVVLSCATAGASIRYTTDGSTPTATSTVYTTPIAVNASMTIKAIAVNSGMTDSAVMTAVYTITTGGGGGGCDTGMGIWGMLAVAWVVLWVIRKKKFGYGALALALWRLRRK